MKDKYNIDDIENFLNKELNTEEMTAFDKKMKEDTELATEVSFHEDVIKGIQTAGVTDFKNLVAGVHSDMKEEGFFVASQDKVQKTEKKEAKVRSISLFRSLAVAASFALMVVAGYWVFSTSPATPEQLFASNFSIHQDVLSTEIEDRLSETGFGTNKKALAVIQDAMNDYNSTQYEASVKKFTVFQQLAPEDALTAYASLYKGIALLKNNQVAAAQKELELVHANEQFPSNKEAKWYLALTYLKQNNIPLAKPLLQELSSVETYQAKAKKILQQL